VASSRNSNAFARRVTAECCDDELYQDVVTWDMMPLLEPESPFEWLTSDLDRIEIAAFHC